MLSFLSPLFLAGAAAAAVPIVLHLLKREPEPRVKFAAVKLLQAGAGRAHREAPAARAAAARAARRGAGAAGAGVRAAVPRERRGGRRDRRDDGRARHVATACRRRGASSGRSSSRRTRSRRRRRGNLVGVVTFADVAEIVAKPSADRVLARSRGRSARAPGFGVDALSRRPLGGGADARPASRHDRRRHRSAGERLGRRRSRVGAGVGAHRGRRRRAARRDLAVVGLRTRRRSASSRRCATSSARAVDARLHLSIDGRGGRRHHRTARAERSRPMCRCLSRGRPVTASVAVDDPRGIAGQQRPLCRRRRIEPVVGAGRHRKRRSRPRRVLSAGGAAGECGRGDDLRCRRRQRLGARRRGRRRGCGLLPRSSLCRRAGSSGARASSWRNT